MILNETSSKGLTMKLYVVAVVIALGAVTMLVNACIFHASANRILPINIGQFK
jgi:hypothetical protein